MDVHGAPTPETLSRTVARRVFRIWPVGNTTTASSKRCSASSKGLSRKSEAGGESGATWGSRSCWGRFSCDSLAEDPQGGDLGPVLRRQRRSHGRTSLLPTTHRQHSHENRRSHDHRKWTNERGQVTWVALLEDTILEEAYGAGRPSSAAARASTGVLCPTSDFSKTGDLT